MGRSMSAAEATVAIVGAGPVGLTAALCLAMDGIDVVVLERLEEPSRDWRASTFHAPTLEIGLQLGIAGEMLRRGLVASRAQYRSRADGVLAEFDFSALSSETPYPFRLQLEQYKYVEILLERLQAFPNVSVEHGIAVDRVEQGRHGVTIHTAGGEARRATWLIAADGARSQVRKDLGLGFDGSTFEHRYLVLSLDYPLDTVLPDICEVNYIADPHEHLMLLRIPDLWRVVLSIPPGVSDESATSEEFIRERLAMIVGSDHDLPVSEVRIYALHERVADSLRVDRIMLAGDAAHVNSPMGGMGLNSGIHDAYDLAAQLFGVISGAEDEKCLEEWAQRRRTVATDEIQRISGQTTRDLAAEEEARISRFQEQMTAIAADPELARQWMLDNSMITNVRRYPLPSVASRWAIR
jgi:3-(3-hydroxy-phenyl)propionate hydroxylase